MMMNNTLMQIVGIMKSGKNPQQILASMAQANPQVKQAMQMMQGKSNAELRQMAMNMAKEQGVNINDVFRQLGLNAPSDK